MFGIKKTIAWAGAPFALAALIVGTAAASGAGPFAPPTSTPMPTPSITAGDTEKQPMTWEEEVRIREEAKQGDGGQGTKAEPTTGPETAGSIIRVAGKEIQLPEDVYIRDHFFVLATCLVDAPEPCYSGAYYVLQRGDSTITVQVGTGQIAAEQIAPGEEGAFDFLKAALSS